MATVVKKDTLEVIYSANTPDYPTGFYLINPDMSIWDTVDKKYTKVQNDVIVEMSQAEKDAVDATNLDSVKAKKYGAIDLKSAQLLAPGFVFSTETFSLSLPAQMNWTNIKANKASFTFPLEISTIDNKKYNLADADVDSFYNTGKDRVKAVLDGGRDLKDQVRVATTIAAVDSIVDDRT